MNKLHVKKNDTVLVLSGKDKGKRGKILRAIPRVNKVVVEGVAVAKRHTRPTQKIRQGGIIEKPMPIFSSKVMLVCPHCLKSTKAKKVVEEGKNVRRCKKCGETVDK